MLGPRLAPGKGGLHASSLQQAKAELSALTGSLGRPFCGSGPRHRPLWLCVGGCVTHGPAKVAKCH